MAKQFHKVEVHNGHNTSFWFDSWSDLGCLEEIVGERGHLDLGIQKPAKVGESGTDDEDVAKWKARDGNYKAKFVTRDTWYQIRTAKPSVNWYKGVWFSQSTPKYTFMSWLAFQNRLAT
ncbi:uncharacterized protein LOC112089730 [Eutrema salsugineum]|uniref:uncharacterized protein LOC112089730 n=1 Tax=Eutrema salsugineum TaxID=72664 RepID=UPI000CED4A7B|nr:uncharacterized protein LOC112089730 [Eutrema salsugineum]